MKEKAKELEGNDACIRQNPERPRLVNGCMLQPNEFINENMVFALHRDENGYETTKEVGPVVLVRKRDEWRSDITEIVEHQWGIETEGENKGRVTPRSLQLKVKFTDGHHETNSFQYWTENMDHWRLAYYAKEIAYHGILKDSIG